MTVTELEARMSPRELVQWVEWIALRTSDAPGSPGQMSHRQQLQRQVGGGS